MDGSKSILNTYKETFKLSSLNKKSEEISHNF